MLYQFQSIAHIENDFSSLFGIPRQPGLCRELSSRIRFEDGYGNPETLRGIEGFSHLWLLWVFSEHVQDGWNPTVRPPKLGGNTRVGVFASRSPYRPNPIGISVVKLEKLDKGVLIVSGADLMSGTPILDIKPYLPYSDSIPNAVSGFAPLPETVQLKVEDPLNCLAVFSPKKRETVRQFLSADPRPGYSQDANRIYGVAFAGKNIRFLVQGDSLTIIDCGDWTNPDDSDSIRRE